jgi:hypothetical protein
MASELHHLDVPMSLRTRVTTTVLLALLLAHSPAAAAPGLWQTLGRGAHWLAGARARATLVRTTSQLHASLVRAKVPLTLPPSDVLMENERQRVYSASWTCRSSTELLLEQLKRRNLDGKLQIASSGQKTFNWGKEGWVSYHYYAVDDPTRPTLLVDPTAASNFGVDGVRPGGLLRELLGEAGRRLAQPGAADRVVARLVRAGDRGLLVLTNRAEIDVYREALERAAEMLRARRD